MHADDNALFYGCFRHMAASRSSDDLRQVCARQLPAAARAASVVTPGAYQVGRGQGGGGGDLRQVCTRQLPTAAGAGSIKAVMAAWGSQGSELEVTGTAANSVCIEGSLGRECELHGYGPAFNL